MKLLGNQRVMLLTMTKVVFVGDEPSKTNIRNDIAFVGAKCFHTLVGWIKELNPDYYICLNSNTIKNLNQIVDLYDNKFRIVALGERASNVLLNRGIYHFKLPHPSGLNRKLNDKEYIKKQLEECKFWFVSNSSMDTLVEESEKLGLYEWSNKGES